MPNGIVELQGYAVSSRNPFSYEKVEQVDRDVSTAWLTLEEITQQLNLDGDESQDSYLTGLELATRMAIEDFLGMSIFATQYRVYYGNSGTLSTQVYLDLPEVSQGESGVTVDEVSYYNEANPPELTPLDPTAYYYDPTGNKIVVTTFPSDVNTFMSNPIVVLYTSNASYYATYPVIKQAGLLMLTHLYNNRSDTTVETLKKLPFGVEQLLRPYKPLVM
jgi:hypothetical protein